MKEIADVTDEQLIALDQLLTQTHRLLGTVDELQEHPMLSDKQQELLDDIYTDVNKLDNLSYARLGIAKKKRNIPSDDHVSDHIEVDA
jgi:hypothetical protein